MAIIKTLKDKAGNTVYPQTRIEAVYDPSGRNWQEAFDGKIDKVDSPTAGNIPVLNAGGGIEDSSKALSAVDNVFIAEYGETTHDEVRAAILAGKYVTVKKGSTAAGWLINYPTAVAITYSFIVKVSTGSQMALLTLYRDDNWTTTANAFYLPQKQEADDAGKVLTVLANGNWGAQDAPKGVFIAEYDVTPFPDIIAAVKSGYAVVLRDATVDDDNIIGGADCMLSSYDEQGGKAYFTRFIKYATSDCEMYIIKVTYDSANDTTTYDWSYKALSVDSSLSDSSTKPVENRVIKAELDKKASITHSHSIEKLGGGTFTDIIKATTAPDITTAQIRNIYAGTADMVVGTTELETGVIYLVYE